MKFFLDHDVAAAVSDALKRHEHEAIRLTELLPPDASDELVFATAQTNGCITITCNRDDFLNLAKRQHHLGLIILIRRRNVHVECANLLRLVAKAGPEGLAGNINFA